MSTPSLLNDIVILGGGIVGTATAMAVIERFPDARVTLVEKESSLACHQSGRNSGVIHSGIYYAPGSLKAQLTREGGRALLAFCDTHGIPYRLTGKLIVATRPEELPHMDALAQRGRENGIPVETLSPEAIREREPEVHGLGGLWVPTTGIIDYGMVTQAYARVFETRGGTIQTGTRVIGMRRVPSGYHLETTKGTLLTRFLINCGGLFVDRLARQAGCKPPAQIVPFRGEYYTLTPDKAVWIRGLVYPVPDPTLPFLGVHLTRTLHGTVHVGPNAVLALQREGYRKTDLHLGDFWETVSYPGFWRLAARYPGQGLAESFRSVFKQRFVREAQRFLPRLTTADLQPAPAGVRAQALMPDGSLAEDFLIAEAPHAIHICNAPSPAATASWAIGRMIASRIPKPDRLQEVPAPAISEMAISTWT